MGTADPRPLALFQAETGGDGTRQPRKKNKSTKEHERQRKKMKKAEKARSAFVARPKPQDPVEVRHVVLRRTMTSDEVKKIWAKKFPELWAAGDTDVSHLDQLESESSHEVRTSNFDPPLLTSAFGRS